MQGQRSNAGNSIGTSAALIGPGRRTATRGRVAQRLTPVAQALALLLVAGGAQASPAFSSAWFAAKGAAQSQVRSSGMTASGGIAGVPSAAQQQAQMQQQMAKSIANLNHAAAAIAAAQAAQAAARQAAFAAPTDVPDGLAPGGLQVDTNSLTKGWTNAQAPTQTVSAGRATVDIQQTADKAILNWQTFNVGRNTTVDFHQQADWVALNRINDPQSRPSRIEGQIKADGTVLLINRNGVIFTGSSQVNTHSLIASALNVTDAQFNQGFVNAQAFDTKANQISPPQFANDQASPAGDVVVEAGAVIQTAPPASVTTGGGSVFLFGGNVSNSGSIATPDGQILLAAGSGVYLTQSMDPDVRGVSANLDNGGTAVNTAQGYLSAPTGNVSMAGMAVEQSGMALATTSVNEAGSITLFAHEGVRAQPNGDFSHPFTYVVPVRSGQVEFAAGSMTAILPDETGQTAPSGQPQGMSVVKAEGETVNVRGAASIVAPAGNVKLQATDDTVGMLALDVPGVSGLFPQYTPDAARVYIGDGAIIDVSGLQGVAEGAADDAVLVNVRGNELRDSPMQRDSVVNGKDIWVDTAGLDQVAADRTYTQGGLLEVSGWIGNVPHDIDQRLTQGGTVSVISSGDAILRPGASINLAGGTIDHQAGYVNRTLLVSANGTIYTANNAPADIDYVSVGMAYDDVHRRWGVTRSYANPLFSGRAWQDEYIQGMNAGTLQVITRQGELDANVDASVFNGVTQRTPDSMARAGTLLLGGNTVLASGHLVVVQPNQVFIGVPYQTPDDVFADSEVSGDGSFDDPRKRDPASLLPDDWTSSVYLSTALLNQAGYGTVVVNAAAGKVDPDTLVSEPAIRMAAGTTLAVQTGGSISLNAGSGIDIAGTLVAHGGSISLSAAQNTGAVNPSDITLAGSAAIDTTGVWVNDAASGITDARGATVIAAYDGGDISISAEGGIDLASGSVLDASSGGWLQIGGKLKTVNGLPAGTGGDISIIADAGQTLGGDDPRHVVLGGLALDATLRSYGLQGGGTLRIAAPAVRIGGAAPAQASGDTGIIPGTVAGTGPGDGTGAGNNSGSGSGAAAGTPDPLAADMAGAASTLWLAPAFFSHGGFGEYDVYSYGALKVASGATIALHPATLAVADPLYTAPTGASIETLLDARAPARYLQAAPVNLMLSAVDPDLGTLDFAANARIQAEPGATISLHATRRMYVDGTIDAPAGIINLDLAGPTPTAYDPSQILWIGADTRLDARGLVRNLADATGQPLDIVLNGGTVNINQNIPADSYYPYAAYPTRASGGALMVTTLGGLVAEAGSVIDVSGASGVVHAYTGGLMQGESALPVATDAGAVVIRGSAGALWDGSFVANGGGPTAAGGSLTIDQSGWAGSAGYPQPVYELVIAQDDPEIPAAVKTDDPDAGPTLPDGAMTSGQMRFGVDRIMAGGFADISLGGLDALVFDGDVGLRAPRSLTINAVNVGATGSSHVTLAAPYVDIGGGRRALSDFGGLTPISLNAAPFEGDGTLRIDAGLIDIEGILKSGATYQYGLTSQFGGDGLAEVPGFASMTFDSTGDIRFVPAADINQASGMQTLGNLAFVAAQAYPITSGPVNASPNGYTNTPFTIRASGTDSTIVFARNGGVLPAPPLSAGGVLDIVAPTIEQGGVLRAPFGQIAFGDPNDPAAAQSITLLPGSITSVSGADLLVPWGQPDGALAYAYGVGSQTVNGVPVILPTTVNAPPAKGVSFYGDSVTVSGADGAQPAARIDASGGGDLYGAQFVSGSMGSADTLNGVNTFAVLPSLGNAYAPRSPLMDSSNPADASAANVNLRPGDQVWLAGVPGLPAGMYTLLPGHYALLPGAFKVALDASRNVTPGAAAQLPDGSYQVSGYRSSANTAIRDSLPSLFTVTPGSVVRTASQYDETTVGAFFNAQAAAANAVAPLLPADAGQITIQAGTALSWRGQTTFAAAPGGRGGQANIIGTQLAILGPGDTAPDGYVGLNDSDLNAIGAQSLLIGGTRVVGGGFFDPVASIFVNTPNALTITASAQQVEIGGHADIKAPEVLLTAVGGVVLDDGAHIDTTGFGAIADAFPTDPGTGKTLGNYALQNGGTLVVASNAPTPLPVDFTGFSPGALSLGAGSRIDALGNVELAAQGDLAIDDRAGFAAHAISVTVPTINLGDGGTGGLNLTSALLALLSSGDAARGLPATVDLELHALQGIDVYGSATVGGVDAGGLPTVANLTLSAPVIQGFGVAGDVATLNAGMLTLEGAADDTAAAGTGVGTLAIHATELTIDQGYLNVAGFGNVTLDAAAQFIGHGTGTLATDGGLAIIAPIVTAQSGANTTLRAAGALDFEQRQAAAPLTDVVSVGAHISAIGQSVTLGTDVLLPSGTLTLDGQDGVALRDGSRIDVSGAITPFFDVVRIAPAGTVNLTSAHGDIDMAASASINLAGGSLAALDRAKTPVIDTLDSDAGGDAGSLNVTAHDGTARLDGHFDTSVPDGYAGAQAIVDVGSGDGATLLAGIAGFTAKQALSLRQGDLVVAGGITAHDIELSAGNGSLTVDGTLDASGASGGSIRLSASGDLTVNGKLDAHATQDGQDGGTVFAGIDGLSGGLLTLAAGALIDVSGSGANGSEVWLRAPRRGAGLALSNGGATVDGARRLAVEAVAVTDVSGNPYVDTNLAAADAAAQSYMGNAAAIAASLGTLAANPAFSLMPGIELRSSGDLTLVANPTGLGDGIDLHTYRYDGQPMVLTLRAAGNLLINGSLSDGFDTPATSIDGTIYAIAPLLPAGPSATIRLVAGADLANPDPDGLLSAAGLAPGQGSLHFNENHIDAGGYPIASVVRTGTGDLELAAAGDISLDTPFGIYTAGAPSAPVAGFDAPQRQTIVSLNQFGVPDTFLGYPFSGDSYDTIYPTSFYPSYPEHGGNLSVRVQGNLTSAPTFSPTTATNAYSGDERASYWLWTMTGLPGQQISKTVQEGSWFINFGEYYQTMGGASSFFAFETAPDVLSFLGLGALGGGNVDVRVGGDMSHVSVGAPTTGRMAAGAAALEDATVSGGGNVQLNVAGALSASTVTVGKGSISVHAAQVGDPTDAYSRVNISPGDAQADVVSDSTMNLFIGDPTRLQTSDPEYFDPDFGNGTIPNGLLGCEPCGTGQLPTLPYGTFTTYTENTSLRAYAAGGDLKLTGDFAPPRLDIAAPGGSVQGIGTQPIYMLPSPTAQVDVLAGQSVQSFTLGMNGELPVWGSDYKPGYSTAATIVNFTDHLNATTPQATIVQTGDTGTAHLYAVDGDLGNPIFSTTKQADLRAGRDITNPQLILQNNADSDLTAVQAGRDITNTDFTTPGAFGTFAIRLGGPGDLLVQAGRDILVGNPSAQIEGNGLGINTVGNADNNLLPTRGASVSVLAGTGSQGPDLPAFIAAYLDPAGAAAGQQNYLPELVQWMSAREADAPLTPEQALAGFKALDAQRQLIFVEQIYFAELKAGGRAVADGTSAGGHGYDRAYRAIQTLFPGSQPGGTTTGYDGDISVYGQGRIRTEAGGDIDMLAPGGSVVLGFENDTPDLSGDQDTARPGLLTLRQGDINTYTDKDVIVAQSRVFTELGGSILMFSDNGDLNAGKGKKTSLVTSPAQFTLDPYDNVTKSPVTPETGAGIATLVGVPGVPPGDVDLFAPHGTIDAGEAGIRVSGNLNIAALHVVNADNIQVQGKSTGLPIVKQVNTAALTSASAAANAASDAAQELTRQQQATARQSLPSIITVQVLGFGDESPSGAGQDRQRPGARQPVAYDAASAVQVLGAGTLNDQEKRPLNDAERGGLTM